LCRSQEGCLDLFYGLPYGILPLDLETREICERLTPGK
jgi:hypothetical protein